MVGAADPGLATAQHSRMELRGSAEPAIHGRPGGHRNSPPLFPHAHIDCKPYNEDRARALAASARGRQGLHRPWLQPRSGYSPRRTCRSSHRVRVDRRGAPHHPGRRNNETWVEAGRARRRDLGAFGRS